MAAVARSGLEQRMGLCCSCDEAGQAQRVFRVPAAVKVATVLCASCTFGKNGDAYLRSMVIRPGALTVLGAPIYQARVGGWHGRWVGGRRHGGGWRSRGDGGQPRWERCWTRRRMCSWDSARCIGIAAAVTGRRLKQRLNFGRCGHKPGATLVGLAVPSTAKGHAVCGLRSLAVL